MPLTQWISISSGDSEDSEEVDWGQPLSTIPRVPTSPANWTILDRELRSLHPPRAIPTARPIISRIPQRSNYLQQSGRNVRQHLRDLRIDLSAGSGGDTVGERELGGLGQNGDREELEEDLMEQIQSLEMAHVQLEDARRELIYLLMGPDVEVRGGTSISFSFLDRLDERDIHVRPSSRPRIDIGALDINGESEGGGNHNWSIAGQTPDISHAKLDRNGNTRKSSVVKLDR